MNITVTLYTCDTTITVVAYFPQTIKKRFYKKVMEYITLANYDIPVGTFKLSPGYGSLFFHTSILWNEDYTPGEKTIRSLVDTGIYNVREHFDSIMGVLRGDVT
jgi:hypothetical protein